MRTVWTKSGPASAPLTRNVVVHVSVEPCGASAATVIASSRTRSVPLVTVCGSDGEYATDRPGSHDTFAVTSAGRLPSPARMAEATPPGATLGRKVPDVADVIREACPVASSPSPDPEFTLMAMTWADTPCSDARASASVWPLLGSWPL